LGALAFGLAEFGVIDAEPLHLGPRERLVAMSVGVLEILWLIPYMHALDASDETLAPPIFQTVPIFGLALGYLFFDEMPSTMQIVAGAIILAGAVVLNANLRSLGAGSRVRVNARVILLMLLASFVIALAAFLFKGTALEENYWGTAFWMSLGGFLTGCGLLAVLPSYRRDLRTFIMRRDRKGLMLNGVNEVTDTIAILVFYAAIMLGPSTAVVQATVAYQPVFLIIIGMMAARMGSDFHSTRLTGRGLAQRAIGITVIVVGSVLIFA
jgi:multidrug transporter EmrE-like cation transporter